MMKRYWGLSQDVTTPCSMARIRLRLTGNSEGRPCSMMCLKSRGKIQGPDVLPFLERVFARRIDTLSEGRGRYAIACTREGGAFMDGILFKMDMDRYWYVQPDGNLETWLMAHKSEFEVTIRDPKSRVLQIQGPNSISIMADLTSGAIDDDMKYFHSGIYDVGGQELYVSRTGWTGELGYEVYSVGAVTDHKRLWDHITESGRAHDMTFGSMASMETRRIEAGILDNLTDFDTAMNPFEAGLGPFIDMEKSDFIGREALQSANRQVLLYGLKCAKAIPGYGGEVVDGSRNRRSGNRGSLVSYPAVRHRLRTI